MPRPPADHRRVIGYGDDRLIRVPGCSRRAVTGRARFDPAAEADPIVDVRTLELPRVAEGQPIFGVFVLPAVADYLLEQPMVVTNAEAVGRNTEARHALHEAGRKPSKPAIA